MAARKKKSTRTRIQPGHKRVKLTCQDRIFLGEAMPVRESHATLRIMRKLRERIALSEAELKQIGFVQSKDGRLSRWEIPGRARVFVFSPFELKTIEGGLRKMDEEKSLAEGHLALWDLFIGDSPE